MPKKRDREDEDEDDDEHPGESQLAAMKASELRLLCEKRQLSTSGTKAVLIERLLK